MYMYWQNRKDRVSEYICVRASGASERFLEFLIVLQLNNVSFFTINVKFKAILSSKSGGMFVQAIPHPKKWGEYIPHPPGIYASVGNWRKRQTVSTERRGIPLEFSDVRKWRNLSTIKIWTSRENGDRHCGVWVPPPLPQHTDYGLQNRALTKQKAQYTMTPLNTKCNTSWLAELT